MPSSSLFLGVGSILSALSPVIATTYKLGDSYTGSSFLDGFDFFTASDPTNGFVSYLDRTAATNAHLVRQSETDTYLGVDFTTPLTVNGRGRSSVRIETKKSYNDGLYIVDLKHMPSSSCGTWPAFWSLGSGQWPNNGEIDIIEGVNRNDRNKMVLHTGDNCKIDGTGHTGATGTTDCSLSGGGTGGCEVNAVNPTTYGTGFNANGGGVYAMEWTSDYISMWFFPRGSIPASIVAEKPNTADFGTPLAHFQGDCDIKKSFVDHRFIFDTTFCGDWAGNVYQQSGCPQYPGLNGQDSCKRFVAQNPSVFSGSYWLISYFKTFKAEKRITTSSSTMSSTSTSTSTISSSTSTTTSNAVTTTSSSSSSSSSVITSSSSTITLSSSSVITSSSSTITLSSSSVVTSSSSTTTSPSSSSSSSLSSSSSTIDPTTTSTVHPTSTSTVDPTSTSTSSTTSSSSSSSTGPASTTTDSSSSTTDSASTTTDPALTTTDSASTTTKLALTTTDPASTTTDPASTTTDSASTTTDLASTTTDPALTTTDPASTTTDPASTTTDPASTTTDPASTTTDPASTTTDPASTTTDPASTATDPSSTTTDPASTTTTSSSSYTSDFNTNTSSASNTIPASTTSSSPSSTSCTTSSSESSTNTPYETYGPPSSSSSVVYPPGNNSTYGAGYGTLSTTSCTTSSTAVYPSGSGYLPGPEYPYGSESTPSSAASTGFSYSYGSEYLSSHVYGSPSNTKSSSVPAYGTPYPSGENYPSGPAYTPGHESPASSPAPHSNPTTSAQTYPSGYPAQGDKTTVTTTITTDYVDICPTGYITRHITHTVTYCPEEATPTPGNPYYPPGFTTTKKVCFHGCGAHPTTVTLTVPYTEAQTTYPIQPAQSAGNPVYTPETPQSQHSYPAGEHYAPEAPKPTVDFSTSAPPAVYPAQPAESPVYNPAVPAYETKPTEAYPAAPKPTVVRVVTLSVVPVPSSVYYGTPAANSSDKATKNAAPSAAPYVESPVPPVESSSAPYVPGTPSCGAPGLPPCGYPAYTAPAGGYEGGNVTVSFGGATGGLGATKTSGVQYFTGAAGRVTVGGFVGVAVGAIAVVLL